MVTTTLVLSGIDMSEDEYLETLSHARRFEFTNGVVPAKRGPFMTEKSHGLNEGARVPEGGALESEALPGFRRELARLWAAIDHAPA